MPDNLECLGHVLREPGITADRSKLDKIRQWPMPTARVEMQSFLSLCNFYHKYIAKYAEAAKPLYTATKELKIEPTPELVTAFERLKSMMCAIPLVRLPNPDKPFILTTDASTIAVGAELSQSDENGEFPVLWFSKALNPAQRNYSTYERELFAVVLSCDAYHVFLLGREFLLRTDHRALMGIFNSKLTNSARITKWLLKLKPYKFSVQIIKGKDNTVAES